MEHISRRQFFMVGTAATFAALGLAGCGGGNSASGAASGNLKDGTYTGQSSTLDANVDGDGYGIISITVENGKIVDAKFEAFEVDGTPKDENYGKGGSSTTARYRAAQAAVEAGSKYADTLVATGMVEDVDVVTGATYLHEQVVEAATEALAQASK